MDEIVTPPRKKSARPGDAAEPLAEHTAQVDELDRQLAPWRARSPTRSASSPSTRPSASVCQASSRSTASSCATPGADQLDPLARPAAAARPARPAAPSRHSSSAQTADQRRLARAVDREGDDLAEAQVLTRRAPSAQQQAVERGAPGVRVELRRQAGAGALLLVEAPPHAGLLGPLADAGDVVVGEAEPGAHRHQRDQVQHADDVEPAGDERQERSTRVEQRGAAARASGRDAVAQRRGRPVRRVACAGGRRPTGPAPPRSPVRAGRAPGS